MFTYRPSADPKPEKRKKFRSVASRLSDRTRYLQRHPVRLYDFTNLWYRKMLRLKNSSNPDNRLFAFSELSRLHDMGFDCKYIFVSALLNSDTPSFKKGVITSICSIELLDELHFELSKESHIKQFFPFYHSFLSKFIELSKSIDPNSSQSKFEAVMELTFTILFFDQIRINERMLDELCNIYCELSVKQNLSYTLLEHMEMLDKYLHSRLFEKDNVTEDDGIFPPDYTFEFESLIALLIFKLLQKEHSIHVLEGLSKLSKRLCFDYGVENSLQFLMQGRYGLESEDYPDIM